MSNHHLYSSAGAGRHAHRTAVAVGAIAVTLLLAGCAGGTDQDTAAGPTAGPTAAPAGGSSAPPPVDTLPASAEGAYPSAIVDEEVDDPRFDDLEAEIVRRYEAAGLPGSSLLVLQDGELVQQEAWGEYTLDTVVPIASASKWLSGAVVMTLVDEGLIDLDAPISTYLPEATGRPGTITMRQLVSFTSELEYDDRIPCMSDLSVTLRACADQILDLPLLGAPGSGYRYGSTHLQVAAAVAEAVTGQTWEELFQERIAGPLAMTDTTFVAARGAGAAPDGHPNPAGGAVSSLGDYGRFLEMLVHDGVAPDGTRILSSAAIAEMQRDQTGDARFISAAANRKRDETPYGVAHWLDVVDDDGVAMVESSPGKFGFRPWIDHVNGIAGVHLIVDRDDTRVADSPDLVAGQAADVQTSGQYVLIATARALGGTLPGDGAEG